MFRYLRIAAAWFCFALCVAFLVLWVRSYFYVDWLWTFTENETGYSVSSWSGGIWCSKGRPLLDVPLDSRRLQWVSHSSAKVQELRGKHNHAINLATFRVYSGAENAIVQVPHWFLILILGVAALIKPKPRLNFSVAELLTAFVVFSVLFAVAVAFSRTILAG
jgi:hypothetical protein